MTEAVEKKEYIDHCSDCGKALVPEQEGPDVEFDPASEHYDNALIIQFDGGYGMFIDRLPQLDGKNYRAIICHECAHRLCETIGWIGKLINPFESHSHKVWRRLADGSIIEPDWSGHTGWDLPHEPLEA